MHRAAKPLHEDDDLAGWRYRNIYASRQWHFYRQTWGCLATRPNESKLHGAQQWQQNWFLRALTTVVKI